MTLVPRHFSGHPYEKRFTAAALRVGRSTGSHWVGGHRDRRVPALARRSRRSRGSILTDLGVRAAKESTAARAARAASRAQRLLPLR